MEKSRFVYLHLKKLGKLQSHFDRFPENELEFFRHSTNFYNYMHNLHKNYLDCYVHKNKPLKEYAIEYKTNMFRMHEHYKTVLKASGKRVNMEVVIDFMNQQSLSSQLFVLRKFEDSVNVIDDIKVVDGDENGKLQEKEKEDNNKECPGAPRKCKL